MKKLLILLAASAGLVSPVLVHAQAAPVPTATPAARYSSSTTQMSVLLADPAAKAVLVKYAPEVANNPDVMDRAAGMTLHEIAEAIRPYSPDALSDKVLALIDADLAKLPAGH